MFSDNSGNSIEIFDGGRGAHNVTHQSACFKELNEMRQEGLLCDITLIAHNIEIPAHKIVLASCSPYFRAMFCGHDFEESRQNEIKIEGVDARSLQLLVDFIYTSRVEVTDDNAQSLLAAANQLRLIAVLEACSKYMENELYPENCLGIRDFAEMHGCVNLMKMADAHIGEHFTEVAKSEEFLSLNVKQISDLVRSNKLVVDGEEDVYESVISWIQFDRSERAKYVFDLMQFVRLPLVSEDYLVSRIETEPLLNEDLRCNRLLSDAFKFQMFYTVPRKSRKILLVVGGYDRRDGLKSVEFFDLNEERWYEGTEMPSAVRGHGIEALGEKVYVVGGYESREVYEYDTKADSWSSGVVMSQKRTWCGFAALNGLIYAVGGSEPGLRSATFFNSAESYNPNTKMWTPIASMLEKRADHGVGVLNNRIYAVGGFNLNSAERYNPETNSWARIANMNSKRGAICVGVLGSFLYAIGGYNGNYLENCEKYDPENDTWTAIANMNIPRGYATAVAHNGMLYVIGGLNESKCLNTTEVYCPKTNTWRLISATMRTARSSHAVCLIERFKLNMTKINSEEKQIT